MGLQQKADMAQITFKGKAIHTTGSLPSLHSQAPNFKLVDKELHDQTLETFRGKKKLIATVPSLDTGTCSLMTRRINEFAKNHPHLTILVISADLPFAQSRFCSQEKTNNVITLSMMRDKEFGKAYGLLIEDSPLAGLLARALLVLDEKNHVLYTQLVHEISQEPDYEPAFKILSSQ